MLFGAKCSVEKRTARCAAVEKRVRRQRDDDQIHTYPHPFLESPKSHCQAMVYNRYCGKRFRNNACVCFEMLSHDFYVLKCHYWSIYYFHRIQVSLGFSLWILVDLEMFLVSFECVDTNCWHHLKLWRGLQSISIFIAWPSGQHHICITQLMVTISAPPQPIWPAHWALLRSTSLQNTTLNIIINFTSPCAVNKIIIHIDLFRIDEDSFNKKKAEAKKKSQENKKANVNDRERIYNFKRAVLFGPIFICSCCKRRLFENSIMKITDNLRTKIDMKRTSLNNMHLFL